MIKALIFDFDGLILDTESPALDGWQLIYAEYGQQFPLEIWLREVVGAAISNFDPAAYLADVTGRSLDQEALRSRQRGYRHKILESMPARPGVIEYLETARCIGLRLAVASGSGHAWVEGYLHQLGLFDYFEAILCREDVRLLKPDPDLFLAALKALHLPADETLVFEDSRNGVLAARRAGIRVVAVPNPITAQAAIEGASLVLGSLADLPLEELLRQVDLDIRLETSSDVSGIRNVEERAFQRLTEADLVDLVRTRGKDSLSMVAVRSGSVTGHILFTPVTLEPHPDSLRGLGIGPLAVLPECQKAGIGSRLMRAGLELCQAQGYDFIVLLGDPRYYSRFGFKPAREYGLTSDYGDGDEFQLLELRPGALTGASGNVKYIPEFKELDC